MKPVDFVSEMKILFGPPASVDPVRFWGEMADAVSRFSGPVLAKVARHFRDNWKWSRPPVIGEVMEVCRTTPRDDGPTDNVPPWVRKRMEEERPVEMSSEQRAANLKKLHDLLAELRATSDMAKAKKTHWLDTPMPEAPLEGVKLSTDLIKVLNRENRNA
jgi:hypothetical protein